MQQDADRCAREAAIGRPVDSGWTSGSSQAQRAKSTASSVAERRLAINGGAQACPGPRARLIRRPPGAPRGSMQEAQRAEASRRRAEARRRIGAELASSGKRVRGTASSAGAAPAGLPVPDSHGGACAERVLFGPRRRSSSSQRRVRAVTETELAPRTSASARERGRRRVRLVDNGQRDDGCARRVLAWSSR